MKATIFRKTVFVFLFCFFYLNTFSFGFLDDYPFREDSALVLENFNNSSNLIHDYQIEFIHRSIKQYQNIGGLCEYHFLRNNFFYSGFDIYQDYYLNSNMFSHQLISNYFSQLKYLLGTRKEQILSVSHQQKLWKGLSTGFIYRAIASPGFYKRQFNNIKSFEAYLNFYSSNEKYDASFIYFANKTIAQENGGIVADSLLSFYKGQERSINVNLNSAEHRIRSRGYALYQSYNFNKALLNDSLKKDTLKKAFIGFEQATEFSRQSFVYGDSETDSGYYSNNFILDSITNDSISFQKIACDLNFIVSDITPFKKESGFKMRFKLGGELNFYQSNQYNVSDTSFSSNSINVSVGFSNNKWFLTSVLKKDLESNNGEPYISDNKFAYRINSILSKVGVDYRNQIVPPEYVSEYYYSNHFIWRNNFDNRKESYMKIFASFFRDQFELSFNRYSVNGYVYYDELLKLPHQDNSKIEINKGQLNINYQLGNWHLLSENIYNFSSTNEIIRFPKFDLMNAIYYKDYFFKKALDASFGVQCHYQTAYYANGLNPANGQFYVQNEVKIGDHPYVDVFIDMTIKTATIFLKIEHLNAGIGERNYFYLPHYPTPTRTLKFGIVWTFKN